MSGFFKNWFRRHLVRQHKGDCEKPDEIVASFLATLEHCQKAWAALHQQPALERIGDLKPAPARIRTKQGVRACRIPR